MCTIWDRIAHVCCSWHYNVKIVIETDMQVVKGGGVLADGCEVQVFKLHVLHIKYNEILLKITSSFCM
jgi:hypothetical protein